jgi:hypothetical protein
VFFLFQFDYFFTYTRKCTVFMGVVIHVLCVLVKLIMGAIILSFNIHSLNLQSHCVKHSLMLNAFIKIQY